MTRLGKVVVGGLVAVLVFVGVGFLVDREGGTPFFDSHGCTAEVDGLVVDLTLEQAENAALITAIAMQRGLPARAASIALATAYQESEIVNIEHGDRDSVGLFQQRPSQGWGTVEQILDPVYSTNAFYDGLVQVEGYEAMEITVAAQAVQRSAYPDAYADHEADGRALASALTGNHEAAFWCDTPGDAEEASDRLDEAGLVARAATVREELESVFGPPLPRRLPARWRLLGPHGRVGALRGPRGRHLLPAGQRGQPGAGLGDGPLPRRAGGPVVDQHDHLRRPHLAGRLAQRQWLDRLRRPVLLPR